jgi:hypothetical protein
MWDLWWTRRHWGRFCPSTSVSLVAHSTGCSTLTIRGWYSRPIVASVPLHPRKLNNKSLSEKTRTNQLHDGVGSDNRVYWTVLQLVNTLHKPLSSLRCLVTASNSGRFSLPGLKSSQTGDHLTSTSSSLHEDPSLLLFNYLQTDALSDERVGLISSRCWTSPA